MATAAVAASLEQLYSIVAQGVWLHWHQYAHTYRSWTTGERAIATWESPDPTPVWPGKQVLGEPGGSLGRYLGTSQCAGDQPKPIAAEEARAVLGVNGEYLVAFLIGVGYPADRAPAPIRKPNRRPFAEVAHHGRW